MSRTQRLLQVLGSPWAKSGAMPVDPAEAISLYRLARVNKIGLLYLEALAGRKAFGELEGEHIAEVRRHAEQQATLRRVTAILSGVGMEYAVFKSCSPFQAVPNDTDIIFFGNRPEFERTLRSLQADGYSLIGRAPLEAMLHDNRNGPHPDPLRKDVYDVDLYLEVAASHLVYLDKRRLHPLCRQFKLDDAVEYTGLAPEADLAAAIIHSVFPERLFCLSIYYTLLSYLSTWDEATTQRFIGLAGDNHIVPAVRAALDLSVALHQAAHGFIPPVLERLVSHVESDRVEMRRLEQNGFETPHRYGNQRLVATLLGKCRERCFLASAARQGLAMLNPKMAVHVLAQARWRARRASY